MGPKPQHRIVSHQKQPGLSLYNDTNPIVIRKPSAKVTQTQKVSLKYLKPPRLRTPGDIIIR